MTTTQKLIAIPALAAVMLAGGAYAGYATLASADTDAAKPAMGEMRKHFGGPGAPDGMHGKGHGVMGTVSAINGSTITVTNLDGTSYTVEAGAATVQKMATGSLADVTVGDRIGVHGTVSGTTVTAEHIMDDLPERPQKPE
ncbi:MAG: hypothetical protein AAB955_03455 [Patescibacteria group bacterium]